MAAEEKNICIITKIDAQEVEILCCTHLKCVGNTWKMLAVVTSACSFSQAPGLSTLTPPTLPLEATFMIMTNWR